MASPTEFNIMPLPNGGNQPTDNSRIQVGSPESPKPDINENLEKQKKEEEKKIKKKKSLFEAKVFLIELAIAAALSLLITMILYLVNPPITQRYNPDTFMTENQDWKKVLFFVLFVFVITFALLEVARRIKTK